MGFWWYINIVISGFYRIAKVIKSISEEPTVDSVSDQDCDNVGCGPLHATVNNIAYVPWVRELRQNFNSELDSMKTLILKFARARRLLVTLVNFFQRQ